MSTPHTPSEAEGTAVSPYGPGVPILPEGATAEQKDEHWYKHVYQGDSKPQLTLRAVLVGGFLGMLMSAANLYTTLSIGWAFGIAITACVLSFVMWNVVVFISRGKISEMSVLENACMASTASAAGYATGSTIATMFGAVVLLAEIPEGKTTADMKTWDITLPWVVTLFTLCTGLMGVFLAIPMKRQMINHEELPFPSGTAAAETLRSLYSRSAEAARKAYVLVLGLGLGILIGFLRAGDDVVDKVGFLKSLFGKIDALRIPSEIEMHFADRLYPGGRHPAGFAFEPSALLIAAGMIVGMRTSLSLVVSSAILFLGVGPWLAQKDAAVIEKPAMMVYTASLDAGKSQSIDGSLPIVLELTRVGNAVADKAAAVAAEQQAEAAFVRDAAGKAVVTKMNEITKEHDALVKSQAKPEEIKKSVEGWMTGVVKAVSTASANATVVSVSEKPGRAARDAAKASAVAAGKPAEEVERLGAVAFQEAKYKPQFNWSWGGGTITIHRWSLWGGTAIMVFSSLTAVALQWRTIARAFSGVGGGGGAARAGIEVPGSWMFIGMVPITIAMVWLQIQAFGVTWYAGLIAVAMSFVLSLVASRATGETDTTPIGAMGKVMQLLFAGLAPANINANLASAGIAANSASSSADLLTDLKTGYLLGANPRRQFLAQFFGVFFGTLAIVPIWYLMVPTREKLESFALPSTRAWEAVARVLTKGISELPASAVQAIFIGAAVGIAIPVIERLLPAKYRKYTPSATGVGLAWVMPFQNAFSFFVGAVIAMIWSKASKRTSDQYNVPIASGLIAGESLMAAGLAIAATLAGLLAST
jgi:uncharacterized oligopeptide transporter (OPT) family protein/uncharacterized protein YbaA (DUF1428 family)